MKKFKLILFIALTLAACKSSKINSSEELGTVFETDSKFNEDLSGVNLNYKILGGVVSLTNKLNADSPSTLFIKEPTNVEILGNTYTVIPGEHITVSYNDTAGAIFLSKENARRSREFAFQNLFFNRTREIYPSFERRSTDFPIDTLLMVEKKLKADIPSYVAKSQALLDSLAVAYQVSDMIKKATEYMLKRMENGSLLFLYQLNEKVLKDNNLYEQKFKEVLQVGNSISSKEQVTFGAGYYQDKFAELFCNINFRKLNSINEVQAGIESIKTNYQGAAKDYMLTKLMYNAGNERIPITDDLKQDYFENCENKDYKLITKDNLKRQENFSRSESNKKKDRLISAKNNSIYTLQDVFDQHEGKIIVLDFWASWCAPCLAQMPDNFELEGQYSSDKVVFIYISIDKEYLQWRTRTKEINLKPANSFVFENLKNSSFLKEYSIDVIPRYMIVGKDGVVRDYKAASEEKDLKALIENELYPAKIAFQKIEGEKLFFAVKKIDIGNGSHSLQIALTSYYVIKKL